MSLEVTKKEFETWCSKWRRQRKSMVGATNESVWKKKTNKIVDEVHNERNGTENANDSQMMTILSTILENGKKRDENLVAWVTNMENELQESQYDNDFECLDDDQTYDENSNVQYVENNVKNSDNTSLKGK